MANDTKKLGLFSKMALLYLGFLALVAGGQMLLLMKVSAGEVGVRYNNLSGLLKEDLDPGWHMQAVGVHRVWRLPSSFIFMNYTGQETLSIRTKDNNTVNVDVSIPYRIIPGSAWKVMDAGNHLRDAFGKYRFQRFAEDVSTSVLRENLARLRSEDFYNTDKRLNVAKDTLAILNEKLKEYHLEAGKVLVRAAYFRGEYEKQLARIQLNEQQKLLDKAKQSVAEQQQALDNFEQRTNALVSAKEQDWTGKISKLERAYQVGFVGDNVDDGTTRPREVLRGTKLPAKKKMIDSATEIMKLDSERITDAHLLGIKVIEAETTEYTQRVRAEAEGRSARLKAEAARELALVNADYEKSLNALLNSPGGRAYIAYHAAGKIQFAPKLIFQSQDGIPSVLRLRRFANQIMEK
jgi:regulator of protease activity HflC (stomatin/prohibitin superfamily)